LDVNIVDIRLASAVKTTREREEETFGIHAPNELLYPVVKVRQVAASG
jgi:hypothetical protein